MAGDEKCTAIDKGPVVDMLLRWAAGPGKSLFAGTRAQVVAGQQRPDCEPVQSIEGGGRFSLARDEAVYLGGKEVEVPDGSGRTMRHGDELDTSTDPWTIRRPYLAEPD